MLAQLKAATGLSLSEFAQQIVISEAKLVDRVIAKKAHASDRVEPQIAKLIIARRDQILRVLLVYDSCRSRGVSRLNRTRLLKSLVPNLRNRYKLLLSIMGEIRSWLRQNPTAQAKDLQQYFCEQAHLEVVGEVSRNRFRQFLLWAPELMPFLVTNLDRLKNGGHLWPLVWEAIAARWEAPRAAGAASSAKNRVSSVVRHAIELGTGSILPREMRLLILSIGHKQQPAAETAAVASSSEQPKRDARKHERITFEKTSAYAIGKMVEGALPRMEAICKELRSLRPRTRTNRVQAGGILQAKGYSQMESEAATYAPGTPLEAARWFVSLKENKGYDTVAQYHKEFRKNVAKS